MQRLITIAVSGTPAALDRLDDKLAVVVEAVTRGGGIEALTTETLDGADAARAIEVLRDAAAGRSRSPIDPTKRGIV